MGIREIAQRMNVSRNTVRAIIRQQGLIPKKVRKDKVEIDPELLGRLYAECKGRKQRVYEKLVEEEGIEVKYSTVTQRLRELGISTPAGSRCEQVPDEPGVEMQHDTSPYKVIIGERKIRVQASLLYLRYSKRRYLKFYRGFNRFQMKCFFYEALTFWGYAASICIIDNTNLARLRGTGKNALIVPEMKMFAEQFGFEFCCHEIGHANRKAGEERSFWTVETNFFPGRSFRSIEDMNQQAFKWATERMYHRPQTKARIIPAKAFEHELAYLEKIPPHIPAPYLTDQRLIDQYGYVAFDGNFYWVPGTGRGNIKVLQYSDRLRIHPRQGSPLDYLLPAHGVKNKKFSPEGMPPPKYKPKNRKRPTQEEEKRLRGISETVSAYLDFALKPKGIQRHEFIRKLFALSRKMTPALFTRSLERARKYEITNINTIGRIATLYMNHADTDFSAVEVDQEYRNRESYQEGCLTDQPDLSVYDRILEEEDQADDEKEEDKDE